MNSDSELIMEEREKGTCGRKQLATCILATVRCKLMTCNKTAGIDDDSNSSALVCKIWLVEFVQTGAVKRRKAIRYGHRR
jgi:hypothetical protein